MTDAIQPLAGAAAQAAAQSAAQASAAKPKISSDFQTFLEMLTVQMQNQDPLNPIDSSDYAVQLATFSSVEQQVLTNDLLNGLLERMSDSGMTQLASWVGMEARTTAPAHFDGAPITLYPPANRLADTASLVVRDTDGSEVQRMPIDISGDPVTWAGVSGDGAPLPSGLYRFEVEHQANGEIVATSPVQTYGRVIEAQNNAGTTTLVLAGGVQVTSSEVSALRDPG
ncbi:flagellar hook capping FlgD N-terminal domain-containing protein [Marimonas lutisalis]|uniref:flagellar hook capping FlgD N-terminal domain-containing protein n=1 Tax=Marimonas lutisalis TaxID=2545756 RepID=UPI0010FA35AF|nr:flagellar hook capping FlgD N-terminal domain-containing protein [Marimonas lutisalis]